MDKIIRTLRRAALAIRIDHYQRQLDGIAMQRANDNAAAEFIQARLERARHCAKALAQP
jgi:hypothetical protein